MDNNLNTFKVVQQYVTLFVSRIHYYFDMFEYFLELEPSWDVSAEIYIRDGK